MVSGLRIFEMQRIRAAGMNVFMQTGGTIGSPTWHNLFAMVSTKPETAIYRLMTMHTEQQKLTFKLVFLLACGVVLLVTS
jgi:hypothetical protein